MHHTEGVPAADILKTCEHLYQQHGYVKWADVGRAHGISRQAVQLRLRALQRRGELDDATYQRWESLTARAAATREREKASNERRNAQRRHELRITLTPENGTWLETEAKLRKVSRADIINGFISKHRNGK